MAKLSKEETLAKIQERIKSLQERAEAVARGETVTRGRAPNPMGTSDEMRHLLFVMRGLKDTGIKYEGLAALVTKVHKMSEKEIAALNEAGQKVFADNPMPEPKTRKKNSSEEG